LQVVRGTQYYTGRWILLSIIDDTGSKAAAENCIWRIGIEGVQDSHCTKTKKVEAEEGIMAQATTTASLRTSSRSSSCQADEETLPVIILSMAQILDTNVVTCPS
jgi:hypothetical protein